MIPAMLIKPKKKKRKERKNDEQTECDDMKNTRVKIRFELSQDEIGDGPIDTEAMWCLIVDKGFQIKNIPMFIEGISYDDVVETTLIERNRHRIINTCQRSDNSTIWVVVYDDKYESEILKSFREVGCSVEGGNPEGYFGVNVPYAVDIEKVYDLISNYSKKKIILADYPSIRH
ncbi:MAG: DUF4265 domain-containing protein [Psychrosphaera sp.]|nr:DUF4265 domain-containing protein [Psychrosphaera sp.]